jgi:hypothetical protein
MNLSSYFTRLAVATGVLSLLFAVSGYAALKPPVLLVKKTHQKVGEALSGAAAHLNGQIYFAGGTTSGGTVSAALTAIDQSTGAVSSLTPMPTARAGLGLVGFFNSTATGNDVLYAIGGTNGSTAVGNVEMYNVTTGQWTEMASMLTPRAYLAVVGGTDGNIYAIGGVDGSGTTVGTVEIFNPTTNSWTTGPSLITARSHLAGTLVYLSQIFVAGGVDTSGNVLNTTELYPLSTGGPWVQAASLNNARADFGLALAGDGYLHALGGRSSTGDLDSIEGYKFSTNTWTTEQRKLETPLSGIAATETLSGAVYLIGGEDKTKLTHFPTKGVPPFEAAHSVTYFVHSYDEPYTLGAFTMDEIAPLEGLGLLELGILSSTNFTTFPAISGTIESGGSLTVDIPSTIIVGLINGLKITAEKEDGTDPEVIGSVSSVLGLSGNVSIPIKTPLRLRNKILVLNISTLLGVDLNLGGGYVTVTLDNLFGKPSNPQ